MADDANNPQFQAGWLQWKILDARRSGGLGGSVKLEAGTYLVNRTIYIKDIAGARLLGDGTYNTELLWQGAADVPMFIIDRCLEPEIGNLSIRCDSGYTLLEAFRLQQTDATYGDAFPGVTISNAWLHDMNIRGQSKIQCGVHLFITDDGDAKNDHHTFERIKMTALKSIDSGVTKARCYDLEGRNAKNIAITRGILDGVAGGVQVTDYGIYNAGVSQAGAALRFDGLCGGMAIADFYIADRNAPCRLDLTYGEKSARCLIVPAGGAGAAGGLPIELTGRFAISDGFAAADREIVQVAADGPLIIHNMKFGSNTAVAADECKLSYVPDGPDPSFDLRGCWIESQSGVVFPDEVPTNADYTTQNQRYRVSGGTGGVVNLGVGT